MTADEPTSVETRVRAPRESRTAVCVPAARELPLLVAAQHNRIRSQAAADERRRARAELLNIARLGSNSVSFEPWLPSHPADDSFPIVMSGHQPELFHPGVLFKDLLVDRVARATNGVGLHLVVDNDLCRAPAIQVPTGAAERVSIVSISYDRSVEAVPYEERRVVDPRQFATFGQRVSEAIRPLVHDPLVADYWPQIVDQGFHLGRLDRGMTVLRQQLETQMGLRIMNVPLSAICDGSVFLQFAARQLSRAEEWWRVYNEELLQFRHQHRVRSQSHPVPALVSDAEWLEVPFWIWTTSDPKRRRLMVRRRGKRLEMSAWSLRGERAYDLGWGDQVEQVAEQLAACRAQGVKLRPRALLTTLFARLYLCDLFVHGIGGGAYDQLTDRLLERLFTISAAPFAITSATLHLPIAHCTVDPGMVAELRVKQREAYFHPETVLPEVAWNRADIQAWIQRKRRWIAEDLPRGERKRRHTEIEAANAALRPWIVPVQDDLRRREQASLKWIAQQRILESRTFSYGLFPEKMMAKSLSDCLIALH